MDSENESLLNWAWVRHNCFGDEYSACDVTCFTSALRLYRLGTRGKRTYEYIERRAREERQRKYDSFIGPRHPGPFTTGTFFSAQSKIMARLFEDGYKR